MKGEREEGFDFRKLSAGGSRERMVLPIPVNPVMYAALRAIYAGEARERWRTDIYGRPYYSYRARDGKITIFYELPAMGYLPWNKPTREITTFQRHFCGPRWGFIYAGRLREAVRELSVETADVFLILMAKIARLPDPRRDTACIRLEEIAELRGVKVRRGSSQRLFEDFRREVLRLNNLRLTMAWPDYTTGKSIAFGGELPDRLLDIVDLEYRRDEKTLTAFRFRCGQALAHFLNPGGLRWVGYYARALLRLSPYHDAFTKKLGTYWIMIGVTAGRKGMYPQASPRTILDFCGVDLNWRNPATPWTYSSRPTAGCWRSAFWRICRC